MFYFSLKNPQNTKIKIKTSENSIRQKSAKTKQTAYRKTPQKTMELFILANSI